MRTLYVTDLDGTLLNNAAELSRYTTDMLNRLIDEGLIFTYATARSFTSASKVTRELRLRMPVATYNGTFLVDPANGEILERCMLDKTLIEPLFQMIQDERVPTLVYSFVDGRERVSWIRGNENAQTLRYIEERGNDKRLRGVNSYSALFEGEPFYLTILSDYSVSQRIVAKVAECIEANAHVTHILQRDTYDQTWWLEIMRADANKASAALKLKAYANVERLVCFGDNLNDLPMFEASDACYAVANANPAVCAAATDVLESNEVDGVARWLYMQTKNADESATILNAPVID